MEYVVDVREDGSYEVLPVADLMANTVKPVNKPVQAIALEMVESKDGIFVWNGEEIRLY